MKKLTVLVLAALAMSIMAIPPSPWIENIGATAGPCGDYQTETITGESGCRDRLQRSACDDGSPWFYNKNYQITRQHMRKYYTNGTRHLCTAWTENGACCNTIAEPPCPDSTCHL